MLVCKLTQSWNFEAVDNWSETRKENIVGIVSIRHLSVDLIASGVTRSARAWRSLVQCQDRVTKPRCQGATFHVLAKDISYPRGTSSVLLALMFS